MCQDKKTFLLQNLPLETRSWRRWRRMTIQPYHRSRRHHVVKYSPYSNILFTRLPSRCPHFTSQYMTGVRCSDWHFLAVSIHPIHQTDRLCHFVTSSGHPCFVARYFPSASTLHPMESRCQIQTFPYSLKVITLCWELPAGIFTHVKHLPP